MNPIAMSPNLGLSLLAGKLPALLVAILKPDQSTVQRSSQYCSLFVRRNVLLGGGVAGGRVGIVVVLLVYCVSDEVLLRALEASYCTSTYQLTVKNRLESSRRMKTDALSPI
jgi:hypothetical protein